VQVWGATEGGLKALCPKVFCGYYQRTGVRIGVKLWASTKKIIVFVFLPESHVNLFFLLHFFFLRVDCAGRAEGVSGGGVVWRGAYMWPSL